MGSDAGLRARRPEFLPQAAYSSAAGYTLLPFRFRHLNDGSGHTLVTSETGEFTCLPRELLAPLVAGELAPDDTHHLELTAKSIITSDEGLAITVRRLASQYRSRKSFIFEGPSLILFVVTLRCDHSCHYCQVSRRAETAAGFDMSETDALAAIDRLFEVPAKHITVEFQGGEPLLAFDRVRQIVLEISRRQLASGKRIAFTMTTTLHYATVEILEFLKQHDFAISTSLDGPREIHDRHRPIPSHDSHARTLVAIERARLALGSDSISALTTATRESLKDPEAIVDSYLAAGFKSIFLRPLSPFGFATRTEGKIGYPMKEFVAFYARALDYMLALNARGIEISEAYASILLTHILTPHSAGYVDLRSPQGAGSGALVFNYDGRVYPSDEARMLAETGNNRLCLGDVHTPYDELMASPVLRLLLETGIAEAQPGCSDCAYLPYCGADPVATIARTGAPIGYTLGSAHCQRHMGLFDILFGHLLAGDAQTIAILRSWVPIRR
jgi:His-Xaa-Ser system radical SAM maturase HxsB